ncbi:MAG TPA: hypothetical protein VFD03_06750 [Clostridia bacterium]|nr:hypothetical protein [Clostridia bacterium]
MTRKQLNKLDIINKANVGFLTVSEAASALEPSNRQVQRLKKKVRELGKIKCRNLGKSTCRLQQIAKIGFL